MPVARIETVWPKDWQHGGTVKYAIRYDGELLSARYDRRSDPRLVEHLRRLNWADEVNSWDSYSRAT